MRFSLLTLSAVSLAMLAFSAVSPSSVMADEPELRIGMIGLDTSHVPAFAKILNDPNAQPPFKGAKVVAAFPAGSPDFPASSTRIEGFTKQIADMGIEIVGSIDELLPKVDAVLLMSVDGRVHLEQAKPVIMAKKRVFIDKPLAADLADVIAIFELAKQNETQVFSSSSSRFSPGYPELKNNDKVGEILGADVYGRTVVTPGHPDLFFYGIHGVELLYTMMGPGCESVMAVATSKYEEVGGLWSDGRIGTYRGVKEPAKVGVGATVFGPKGTAHSDAGYDYKPLVAEIVTFFRSGKPPVSSEETIEIFAFMTAAEQSKAEGGKRVAIADVIEEARERAKTKLAK